jgi:methylthioadenosine phosphorylase (EC 2.4.2.28)
MSNKKTVLGIIGGSGVYDIDGLTNTRWEKIESPFGEPSDELLFGELDGQKMVFLPRHGRGHKIPPSEINFKANIDVLKKARRDRCDLSQRGWLFKGRIKTRYVCDC